MRSSTDQEICQIGRCTREVDGIYTDQFPDMEGPATIHEAARAPTVERPVCRWHHLQGEATDWFFKLIAPLAVVGFALGIALSDGSNIERLAYGLIGAFSVVSAPYWGIILSQIALNLTQKTNFEEQ